MIAFKVTGIPELQRVLRNLGKALGDKLAVATRAGALIVQNDAANRAPFITGTLKRSIHMETVEKSWNRVVVLVGTDTKYARRIEYGFIGPDKLGRMFNQPPRPYLRPALDENRQAVEREIVETLRAVLRGHAR